MEMVEQQEIKALMVTTAHKGVFFGYGALTNAASIQLTDAQMCVHWSRDMRGVLGLASQGPSSSCRIGPPVPSIILRDVTSVVEVSKAAAAKWKQAPWC